MTLRQRRMVWARCLIWLAITVVAIATLAESLHRNDWLWVGIEAGAALIAVAQTRAAWVKLENDV